MEYKWRSRPISNYRKPENDRGNAFIGAVGSHAALSGDGVLLKIAHGTGFAVLGVLQMLLWRDVRRNTSTLVLIGLGVALIDETIQLFVVGSAGLVKDILD